MRQQDELWHWGIKGMKWGVRRYQNKDGTLTAAGKKHYGDGDADAGDEAAEYAPKAPKKKVGDYSDEELRAQINRMQMEKQYRDLSGQTNVREDDPNRELKLQRERLQLQRDVKSLKKEINGGQTFVKTVLNTAGQQALSTMMKGAKDSEEARKARFQGTTSAILSTVTALKNLNFQMQQTNKLQAELAKLTPGTEAYDSKQSEILSSKSSFIGFASNLADALNMEDTGKRAMLIFANSIQDHWGEVSKAFQTVMTKVSAGMSEGMKHCGRQGVRTAAGKEQQVIDIWAAREKG